MPELIEGNLLIVDDDMDVLETARLFLKQKFSTVDTLESPEKIDAWLDEKEADVVLLDMNFSKGEMDGAAGIRWLKKIKSRSPLTTVIMITAYGDVSLAVESMKEGATDFVIKPWNNEKLFGTLKAALDLKLSRMELSRLQEVNDKMNREMDRSFSVIIGVTPAKKRMFELIEKVAVTDANVLILGENGTGKELVARALHRLSGRKDKVFIRVDLGALTGTLFESELFGHVRGAFTDARSDRAGIFELAKGGTIFLDEIGNLSLTLQAKLLAVIQNREIMRVGSNKITPVDFRLICATNMDLNTLASKDRPEFRNDLLYRINTVEIKVPSLRDRTEDIPDLAVHFLKIYGRKYGKEGIRLTRLEIKKLSSYSWPGNVRELQHTIEKAVILSDGKKIPENLFNLVGTSESVLPKPQKLEDLEKDSIEKTVRLNQGNLTRAAQDLGITRATLYRKMEKYGL